MEIVRQSTCVSPQQTLCLGQKNILCKSFPVPLCLHSSNIDQDKAFPLFVSHNSCYFNTGKKGDIGALYSEKWNNPIDKRALLNVISARIPSERLVFYFRVYCKKKSLNYSSFEPLTARLRRSIISFLNLLPASCRLLLLPAPYRLPSAACYLPPASATYLLLPALCCQHPAVCFLLPADPSLSWCLSPGASCTCKQRESK